MNELRLKIKLSAEQPEGDRRAMSILDRLGMHDDSAA